MVIFSFQFFGFTMSLCHVLLKLKKSLMHSRVDSLQSLNEITENRKKLKSKSKAMLCKFVGRATLVISGRILQFSRGSSPE